MHTFKIMFLTASAVTGAFAVKALLHFHKSHVSNWIEKQRHKIESLADLAGIDIGSEVVRYLSFAGPAVVFALQIAFKRKLAKVDVQLPDALTILGNALKSGLSLPQAIEMARAELPSPLGAEFSRVSSQLKLGRPVEEALAIFAQRLPTGDVDLFFQSVSILRASGGNLVETFATLASTIEGRLRVADRIRVLTAQGVYQGIMLLAMPWMLGLMLYFVAPEYIYPLLSTRLGAFLVAVGIALEVAGAAWLKKIVVIKV